VVLTGSQSERALTASVFGQCEKRDHVIDLAGQLTIGELASLIEQARLLICNNSGPAHIAAAVQTLVVDLYALTNPQHTPWQVPHQLLYNDVPCRNCYSSICPEGTNACLNGVGPDTVVAAAMALLRTNASESWKSMVA